MPSSITLTVSHLPSSTSFFLAALQPLDYAYRGRSGQTIGFGSSVSRSTPADFWITQEIPGVPAGAAHVAFPAPSRAAVQDFFVAALKAGGKIYGEPCVRDASGYYSAAVIDFDGNSIEAVHRPAFSDDKENDSKSLVSRTRSTAGPRSVSGSNASQASSSQAVSRVAISSSSGDIFDNLFSEARNAADVARQLVNHARPSDSAARTTESGAGNAVLGTLLGVAAGAALHYAFSKNYNESNERPQRRPSVSERSATEPAPRSEYSTQPRGRRALEAPPSSYSPRMITMHDNETGSGYASTVRPASSKARSRSISAIRSSFSKGRDAENDSTTSRGSRKTGVRMIDAPPSSYRGPSVASTTHDRAPTRSRASSLSRRSSHSDGDRTVVRVREETVFSAARYPLPASTISKASSRRSSKTTATEPEKYPLPMSRASTWNGSETISRSGGNGKSRSGRSSTAPSQHATASVIGKTREMRTLDVPKGELTPDDSVSQISVGGKSAGSRRSRR